MENWELGRMHGAFEVVQSLEEANAAASSSVLWACLIAAFSLGISALITVFTLKSVKSRILDTSSAIGSSVTGLKGASRILTDDAHETLSKTSEMATSVSETTQNISIVTDAMNEMGNAIEEIAQRSSEASQIANTAVEKAAAAVKVLSQLGECSSRIENVVGVINTLAEQTNLLALNATIEAARAGESGKGFAVVASEVKELANQTTVATEDIAKVVSAIREATKTAVKCVDDVDAVITDINGLQSAIAAAVEEQSVTTREVGRNLDGISAASADLSRHIETVTMSANRTNARVEESVTMIADISRAANDVPRLVGVEINDSFQTVTTTTA